MAPSRSKRRRIQTSRSEPEKHDEELARSPAPEAILSEVPDPSAEPPEGDVPDEEQEQWDAFREEQYEVLEQLPLSLHRMFTLLRELDDRYQSHLAEMQSAIREYIAYREALVSKPEAGGVKDQPLVEEDNKMKIEYVPDSIDPRIDSGGPSSGRAIRGSKREHSSSSTWHETKSSSAPPAPSDESFETQAGSYKSKTRVLLERIAWLSAESYRASEEKLALAQTAYNSVDRHVRSLDSVISSEEAALVLGLRVGTQPLNAALANGIATTDSHRPRNGRSRKRAKPHTTEALEEPPSQEPQLADITPLPGIGLPAAIPNMPVDPNEPRYCYCNQVSYGEMIGCDNEDCEREWFHYGCVGLTEAPKNEWYCRDCELLFGKPRKRKN